MGLYSYLQPQAARLMKIDSSFRQRYLKTFESLNGKESYRGQSVGSLFHDYMEGLNEWKPGPIENYKEVFHAARSFVLPMNPPRFEMEHALRKFLANHGITIKKPHFERAKPPAGEGSSAGAAASQKRRRRRKPKPPAATP
jgi:poly(A) polymerase